MCDTACHDRKQRKIPNSVSTWHQPTTNRQHKRSYLHSELYLGVAKTLPCHVTWDLPIDVDRPPRRSSTTWVPVPSSNTKIYSVNGGDYVRVVRVFFLRGADAMLCSSILLLRVQAFITTLQNEMAVRSFFKLSKPSAETFVVNSVAGQHQI